MPPQLDTSTRSLEEIVPTAEPERSSGRAVRVKVQKKAGHLLPGFLLLETAFKVVPELRIPNLE